MGTRVEFNDVLALRPWSPEATVETVVPPDTELCEAWGHPFRKSGHRVYPVDKLIPLLETEGEGQFRRLLAYVQLKYYGVEQTFAGTETFGEYVIKRVVSKEECASWLQMLCK
jgi:hypothetical protein